MESIDQTTSSDENEGEEYEKDEEDESSSSSEDEEKCKRSSSENGNENLPGEPCTCGKCGGQLVLSKKPHKCNDPKHIGNRCVFAAFCLANYDNGDNKWNNQCIACAHRDSKVRLLMSIATMLVYVPF